MPAINGDGCIMPTAVSEIRPADSTQIRTFSSIVLVITGVVNSLVANQGKLAALLAHIIAGIENAALFCIRKMVRLQTETTTYIKCLRNFSLCPGHKTKPFCNYLVFICFQRMCANAVKIEGKIAVGARCKHVPLLFFCPEAAL